MSWVLDTECRLPGSNRISFLWHAACSAGIRPMRSPFPERNGASYKYVLFFVFLDFLFPTLFHVRPVRLALVAVVSVFAEPASILSKPVPLRHGRTRFSHCFSHNSSQVSFSGQSEKTIIRLIISAVFLTARLRISLSISNSLASPLLASPAQVQSAIISITSIRFTSSGQFTSK